MIAKVPPQVLKVAVSQTATAPVQVSLAFIILCLLTTWATSGVVRVSQKDRSSKNVLICLLYVPYHLWSGSAMNRLHEEKGKMATDAKGLKYIAQHQADQSTGDQLVTQIETYKTVQL